ncbi:hypothetical protein AAFP30_15655 [Gordonia sp. CPCC 205515]|uniref:hypothetical protein n=1 Tax=Gordonia sp. CPCC 205515 TaxID=3140791 RepID=UPI003AF3CACB
MTILDAPALAGSRDRAQQMLAGLASDLSGVEVVIDCGGLLAAAVSFADELVHEVLVVRHARSLRVVRVSDPKFAEYLTERAVEHEVVDRLVFL